jgi:hypothetical protein
MPVGITWPENQSCRWGASLLRQMIALQGRHLSQEREKCHFDTPSLRPDVRGASHSNQTGSTIGWTTSASPHLKHEQGTMAEKTRIVEVIHQNGAAAYSTRHSGAILFEIQEGDHRGKRGSVMELSALVDAVAWDQSHVVMCETSELMTWREFKNRQGSGR